MFGIKKIGASVFGTLFILILASLIFIGPVIEMNSPENAKDIFIQTFETLVPEEQATNSLLFLKAQCGLTSEDSIILPTEEHNLTINCTDIMRSSTAADLYEIIGTKAFEDTYYAQYDCSFFNCMWKGQHSVFFSEYGHNYLKSFVIYLYIGLAVTSILLLVCSDIPFGAFKNFGISMIFVGVSYFFIGFTDKMTTKIFEKLPIQLVSSVQEITMQLTSQVSEKLLYVFVIGVVLTAIGFLGGMFFRKGSKKKKK